MYELTIHNNHLLFSSGGKICLLDTGSPVSIGNIPNINLAGNSYPLQMEQWGLTIEQLSSMVEAEFDILIGGDILRNFIFTIDYNNKKLMIETEFIKNATDILRIELIGGVPAIPATAGQEKLTLFWDTGAKISYLPQTVKRTEIETEVIVDFYPGFGTFQTELGKAPIKIQNREYLITTGVLPESIQQVVSSMGADGILGNDILSFVIPSFDYSRERLLMRNIRQ